MSMDTDKRTIILTAAAAISVMNIVAFALMVYDKRFSSPAGAGPLTAQIEDLRHSAMSWQVARDGKDAVWGDSML